MRKLLCVLAWTLATSAAGLSAQIQPIDTQRSTITVHVRKAGLFSVAGHEHWVDAPLAGGVLSDTGSPRVEFKVHAAEMKVKPDPKVSAGDQAAIQKDMQELALESGRYPEIVFRSARVVEQAAGQWKVEGGLTLHGATKPVSVTVRREGGAYTGRAVIRQTDFGIRPISAAGGLVKVKNELEIDFRIVTRQP